MMTQNIKMGGAVKQFEAMQSSASTKGIRNSKGSSFDSVMEQKTNKRDAEPVKKPESTLQAKDVNTLNGSKEDNSGAVSEIQEKMDETDVAALIQGQQAVTENTAKSEQDAITEISETIQKVLGISKEELESAMELLGINFIDLQQPGVLQQLVTQVGGDGDISNLLTNEELAGKLTQLVSELGELFETYKDLPVFSETSEIPTTLPLKEGMQQPDKTLELHEATVKEQAIPETEQVKPDNITSDKKTVNTKNAEAVQVKQESLAKPEEVKDAVSEIQFEVKKVGTASSMDQQPQSGSGEKGSEPKTMAEGLDRFIQNLAGSAVQETEFTEQTANIQDIREITRQITEQIRVTIRPTQTEMEMQLNPEHLGRIQLNITSKAGIMTAHFTTETQVAKEAIESQLQMFQENIERQGLKVEAMEVTVGTFDFAQSDGTGNGKQEQKQNRKKAMESLDADSLHEVTEADSILLDMMEQNGNTIDYSA